ncbi:hypothetical protein HMPREF2660_08520 [Weeksella sp. HMSC059D05]|nr:hypothetical protein HMPREF2660_08520 [Weeksella sp. HMSC059D05]
MCNKKQSFQTKNKIIESSLSSRSKKALLAYSVYVENKKIKEGELMFEDINLDLTKLAKMRRVGMMTVTEVENFYRENNLPFKLIDFTTSNLNLL